MRDGFVTFILIAALLYILSPIDLIPVVGSADDVAAEKGTLRKGDILLFYFGSWASAGSEREFQAHAERVILVKHILPRVAAVQTWWQIPPMEARAVLGIAPSYIKAGREVGKH